MPSLPLLLVAGRHTGRGVLFKRLEPIGGLRLVDPREPGGADTPAEEPMVLLLRNPRDQFASILAGANAAAILRATLRALGAHGVDALPSDGMPLDELAGQIGGPWNAPTPAHLYEAHALAWMRELAAHVGRAALIVDATALGNANGGSAALRGRVEQRFAAFGRRLSLEGFRCRSYRAVAGRRPDGTGFALDPRDLGRRESACLRALLAGRPEPSGTGRSVAAETLAWLDPPHRHFALPFL